ncbi:uncharacterized protein LOC21400808 [Morus notabilis]|uniref:uncharacterized protein LOC21400808 n=1 Tax=Morus notabilis TaxID=981085 RepID=UPI000CED17F5|nr:uncharacterized protein LOC21400808 [Morus notabilis]
MLATRIRPPAQNSRFCSVLKRPLSFFPQALKMAEIRANSKRPTCPTCAKPAWLCLCARIKTRELDNSVSVTILQHSLEEKHPLNSARIARLGLKNVNLATVSDVNFEAQFVIRLMERNSEMGSFCGSKENEFDEVFEDVGDLAHQVFAKCLKEKSFDFIGANGKSGLESDIRDSKNTKNHVESLYFEKKSGLGRIQEGVGAKDDFGFETSDKQPVKQPDEEKITNLVYDEGPVITATIGKKGVVSCLSHIWMLQNHHGKSNFDEILESQAARDALAKGYVVQKLQKRQREGSLELEEYMEFEIAVPPGSILLFPSKQAVGVDRLKAIALDVTNLIVLDGTWAKAKRMYAENPWLKLLPHLKLELDKVSLYSGVRMQPKAGCLSSIESIVYALKELGDENHEGLDDLLDVFESMVGDQKRCKERRLSNAS